MKTAFPLSESLANVTKPVPHPQPVWEQTAEELRNTFNRKTLRPLPRVWLRKILVCSAGLALMQMRQQDLARLEIFIGLMVVLGTFWSSSIDAQFVHHQLYVVFIPGWKYRISLKGATRLEKEWNEDAGLGEVLCLGLYRPVLAGIFDWLLPWSAGDHALWVKQANGQRVLVCRTRSQRSFFRNVKIVQEMTRLPTVRYLAV